jgi:hypothetical protein
MEAVQIKKFFAGAKIHAKIAVRGFFRMMCGAIIAGLLAASVYGIANINDESGWTAVSEFVVSAAASMLALFGMYVMGGKRRG